MIVKKRLDPEQLWFPRARFGMFIHFGLYAMLGRGEWVMYRENIPREDYEKLARRFNPRKFVAEEWVEAAQRSGCRYMTVTAKHHDGFCLFDSALTDYKITNTPFKRDLIGELIAACQRAKLPILLYYSQPDWHHPNFVHRPGAFKDLQYQRAGDTPDWPAFLEYYIGQVRELCSNYGRIDGIWFDGVQRTEQQWQGRRVYDMIRKLQPHAVVNDRAGYGDFFTPERSLSHLPAAAGYMVEACQSVAHAAWGYQSDTALYSTDNLLRSMVKMAAANGNYLLNVGPKPDGSLPQDWLERMLEMGEWLGLHGRSVYGTEGCPLHSEAPDRLYTRRGKRLYLHLLAWPEWDQLELTQLRVAPKSARMLATGEMLKVQVAEGKTVVRGLPSLPPSRGVNVIELVFETERMLKPVPREPVPEAVELTGAVALSPEHAAVQGFGFKGNLLHRLTLKPAETVTVSPAVETFAPNWQPEQTARWTVQCQRPGAYRVSVELASPRPYEGTQFEVRVGEQTLSGKVPITPSYSDFTLVPLGEVKLPKGETVVTLRPTKPVYANHFAMVKGLRLERVG